MSKIADYRRQPSPYTKILRQGSHPHFIAVSKRIPRRAEPLKIKAVLLNAAAAAKVATALVRMEQGDFSTTKGIGERILECRTNFGPDCNRLISQ
jgi:hypothetical protein